MTPPPLLLVLSSSRGGSSVFVELLRRARALRHLPGEVNPLLRVAGLGYPDAGTPSDALDASHAEGPRAERFLRLLDAQAGWPGVADWSTFPRQVWERLAWQWPHLALRPDDVTAAVDAAWTLADDPPAFTRAVVNQLRRDYPVHAGLYDLPPVPDDPAPPPVAVLEEPPFVLLAPWKRVDDPELPVVIKAPSNAYRLDFYRRLFPRIRLIHLTRNPAASVNGLVDGWRHTGFHAFDVPPLAIEGYTDQVPGGDRWWKFDLAPGWEGWRDRSLLDVVAFQWVSAHRAILDWTAAHPEVDCLTLRFEDFLSDPVEVVSRMYRWLDTPVEGRVTAAARAGLPPVMATSAPRARRWFERAELLGPVLRRPDVVETAERLGYPDPRSWQ